MSEQDLAPGEPLPCGTIVYRAIRKGWLEPASGELLPAAYLRRQSGDEDGLSVTRSLDRARDSLQRCAAVVSLHVGHVRDLKLDVVADPTSDDPHHALLLNLPDWADEGSETRRAAQRLADRLVARSRIQWTRAGGITSPDRPSG